MEINAQEKSSISDPVMLINICGHIPLDFSHFIFGHSTNKPSIVAHATPTKLPKNQISPMKPKVFATLCGG